MTKEKVTPIKSRRAVSSRTGRRDNRLKVDLRVSTRVAEAFGILQIWRLRARPICPKLSGPLPPHSSFAGKGGIDAGLDAPESKLITRTGLRLRDYWRRPGTGSVRLDRHVARSAMLTDKITAPTCVRGEDLYDEDQPWVSHLFLGGIELRHCALMVVWLSVALYVAAFAVPYDIQSYGFGIFLIGLIWCWAVNLTYSWWANVLY